MKAKQSLGFKLKYWAVMTAVWVALICLIALVYWADHLRFNY